MEEMKCRHCGAALAAGSRFCTSCGNPAEPAAPAAFCKHCGAELKEGSRFCTGCGQPVVQEASVPTCKNCGAELKEGSRFCTSCGQAVVQAEPVQTSAPAAPVLTYDAISPSAEAPAVNVGSMTKEEYRTVCQNEKYLKSLKTAAIICYVCAAINVLLGIVTANFLVLIDVIISVPLAVMLQKKKSKKIAVALLVYGIAVVAINLLLSGRFAGWLWLVAGFSAMNAFKICDKEYDEAQRG